MRILRRTAATAFVFFGASLAAQQSQQNPWFWTAKAEVRANYRNSEHENFPLRFPFPADFLPVGQTRGFEETVNSGRHTELSVAQLKLDLGYGKLFLAHTQIHAQDKYRRNPTSGDKKVDADELWIRFGDKPDFLERPDGTSFFLQLGKAPRLERQPTRLLESYGLTATAFNRFEDVQAQLGGSVGRNFYWRLIAANGNPLYFRDPNALAGDNGVKALLQKNPNPPLKSGFPILYNAETEDYFFNSTHTQYGQALGYRWANDDQSTGFDLIVFHYRRKLVDREKLTGTFYGAEIDLLNGPEPFGISLPISGRKKEEYGGRLYAEWHGLTTIAQYTKQNAAGLHRNGYEFETGYKIPLGRGPFSYIQPTGRISGISNTFRAAADKRFPAPSVWWPWTKIDYGVRIGLPKYADITIERTKSNIGTPSNVGAPPRIHTRETLVTLRIRV
jgi:hypothetical protein